MASSWVFTTLAPADGVVTADGNLLTTAGLARITSLIIGGGGQAASNGSAGLGVGDTSTAAQRCRHRAWVELH